MTFKLCWSLLFVSVALALDDKCRSLLAGQDQIRLLGALHSRFVVISTNGNLFDMSANASWNSSSNKLQLNAGDALKDKWPSLNRTLAGGKFPLVVALTDNQRGYIVAFSNDSYGNSTMFDVESGTMTSFKAGLKLPSSVSVSSSDFGCMYGLSDGNRLTKYTLSQTMLREERSFELSWTKFLCSRRNDEVLLSEDACTKELDWQVDAGFEQQGLLYLIESKVVHVVDLTKLQNHQAVPFTDVPYDHFFECSNQMTASPVSQRNGSTEASVPTDQVSPDSVDVWIIVAVVVVIIMVGLVAFLFALVYCRSRPTNANAAQPVQPSRLELVREKLIKNGNKRLLEKLDHEEYDSEIIGEFDALSDELDSMHSTFVSSGPILTDSLPSGGKTRYCMAQSASHKSHTTRKPTSGSVTTGSLPSGGKTPYRTARSASHKSRSTRKQPTSGTHYLSAQSASGTSARN